MGGMKRKRGTAIKGTMHHAKTSFSTEIFAGAILSVVQYLTPLRYCIGHCIGHITSRNMLSPSQDERYKTHL
jgi:hypothetical protein